MTDYKFPVGFEVQLRLGGPHMLVRENLNLPQGPAALCIWLSHGKLRELICLETELVEADDDAFEPFTVFPQI